MSEKVSIIVVHKDQPEYLDLYLKSIKLNSVNNDYEIILVDNNSQQEDSKAYLKSIIGNNIKIHISQQDLEYSQCLLLAYNMIDINTGYLIFSHADNVVLSPKWLDFMIEGCLDNPKTGCYFVGPTMEYTNIEGNKEQGPNYNFMFTPKIVFEGLHGFHFKSCQHIGMVMGYRIQLQKSELNTVLIEPRGFLHHYGLGGISKEKKEQDLRKMYDNLIQKK